MKTNILSFLLGICMMIILSMGTKTNNLFIVKPARPISVVKTSSWEESQQFIRKGYIVKTAFGDYHKSYILEKY